MDEPETNAWELDIIKLTDPGNFLARELPSEARSSSFQEFVHMTEKMSEYLNLAAEQGEPPFKGSLDEICAAQKGDTWYRLRIEEYLSNSNGQKVRCSVIDVGSEVTLNLMRLHRIPTKFKNFPPQVHQCCLFGVLPLTLQMSMTENGLLATPRPNEKWDPSATTFMSQNMKDCYKCKALTVRQDTNSVYYLKLYFYINSEWLNFNDELVRKDYAIQVPGQETPQSYANLEMPALIEISESDSSPEKHPKRHKQDIESSESAFEKYVPSRELAACPPLPAVNSISALGKSSLTSHLMTLSDVSEKSHLNGAMAMSGFQTSKPTPAVGRGRAKVLLNALKKIDVGLLSKNQENVNSCLALSSICSKSPEPNYTASVPPLEPCGTSVAKSLPLSNNWRASLSQHSSDSEQSISKSSAIMSLDNSSNTLSKTSLPLKSKDSVHKSIKPRSPDSDGNNNGSNSRHTNSSTFITGRTAEQSDSLSSHSSETRNMSRLQVEEEVKAPEVLSDGFHSSASGVGVRLRERKILDDVVAVANSQALTEEQNAEIFESRKEYFGQEEGRKFLEQLRMRSGLEMISPEDTVPKTSLHGKSQLPRLGTLVYGTSVPMGLYSLEHVPFTRAVKKELKETFDKELALGIEAYSWPSILRGRHVIGIGKPGQEKNTLAYIPPLITMLSDKNSYRDVPRGIGPLAIIVVPTWKKVQEVHDVVECFIGSSSLDGNKQIKCIPLYAGGTENDHTVQLSMMKGYEILITTPNSLLRKKDEQMVNLLRVCHMIVDDIDILLSQFPSEIERIMQTFATCVKSRGDSNIPKQVLVFSKIWNNDIDTFRLHYTEEPVIAFSSRVEASVYGGVKQVVTLSAFEQRLEKFCSLVDRMSESGQKVIAWTSDVKDAVEMSKALSSQGIYTLLAHHEFLDEVMDEVKVRWHQASQSKNLMVLVSTDPCYEDLNIIDATTVIHYDIPSRTRFGNRLACMYQYFSNRLSAIEPAIEPVSHVILTEKCPSHARSLFSLFKRSKSSYPRQLESFVKGYQWGLQNEYGTELCPLLKAYGSCQNDRCELRHVLAPDLDFKTGETTSNDLPASGEVKVQVIHVVNSTRFYCHLLQHRSPDSKDYTDKKLAYQSLVVEISVFYSKPSNHVPYTPSDNLFEEGLCGFKNESGTVDRAKVLEVKEGTNREPMKQCKVWLVDHGIYKFGTVDQLVKLPRRLAEVQYQAVEVFVCRVKPVDHDLEWTKKADIFIEKLVKDKHLIGRIILRLGMTLWLDPLVHRVKIKGVGFANDLVIRQELLVNNFGAANPDHIKSLYELCRGQTEIPENIMLQYFDYCLEMELTQETLPVTQATHKINMVGITSPLDFYVQRWDKMAEMEELEIGIEKEVASIESDEEESSSCEVPLDPGTICLAKSDGSWLRAKIVQRDTRCVTVFHLDYGTVEVVLPRKILPLPRHLAKLPCQAIECELTNVLPAFDNKTWPDNISDYMCNFAQYVDEVQKCLEATVIARTSATYTIGQKLIIDVAYAGGPSLTEDLVWHMVATTVEEDLQPLFGKPALKSQLFFNPVDKIPYLCANIYWETNLDAAIQLTEEIMQLLDARPEGWDSILEERGVLQPVIKLIGYSGFADVNRILLLSLVFCCKNSYRLCELCCDEHLAYALNYCIEMVNKPAFQRQGLDAVASLIENNCFIEAASSSELKRTVINLLVVHRKCRLISKPLQDACIAVAKFLLLETDSHDLDTHCGRLLPVIQEVSGHLDIVVDDLAAWMGLLNIIVSTRSQKAHKHIMRENYIKHVMSLFYRVNQSQCLVYLLQILQGLIEKDKKNKTILLEHNAMIILKQFLATNLDPAMRSMCVSVCSALTLNFPTPETLSGVRVFPEKQAEKIVAPSVTWTESCFRVMLKVRVKNSSAKDFTISRNYLACNVTGDGEKYVFDWELYGDVVIEKSSIHTNMYHAVISLRKDKKGKWGRLLKNKTKPFNLNADFERLLTSDEELDEDKDDDAADFFKIKEKKGIFDGLPAVRLGNPPSDDLSSDDSLVLASSDDDNDEPKVNYEAFFQNYKH